jgi:hypothetical protein
VSSATSQLAGSYVLAKMVEGRTATYTEYDTIDEAIVAARTDITEATRLPVHNKTLVIVSDDRHRIVWAAASDGWVTDYRPGSSPEMG